MQSTEHNPHPVKFHTFAQSGVFTNSPLKAGAHTSQDTSQLKFKILYFQLWALPVGLLRESPAGNPQWLQAMRLSPVRGFQQLLAQLSAKELQLHGPESAVRADRACGVHMHPMSGRLYGWSLSGVRRWVLRESTPAGKQLSALRLRRRALQRDHRGVHHVPRKHRGLALRALQAGLLGWSGRGLWSLSLPHGRIGERTMRQHRWSMPV